MKWQVSYPHSLWSCNNIFNCLTWKKNTCEGKKAWKLAKENIHADIFHVFQPLGNLMKWCDLRLQVFRQQSCSKSFFFLLYTKLMLFHDFGTVKNRCISSIQATNAPVQKNFFSVFISTDSLDLGKGSH